MTTQENPSNDPSTMTRAAVDITQEKVSSRFGATLFAQLAQLAFSVFTVGLIPRVLGPRDFGDYSFIYKTGSSIRSFLDLGASNTFFTYSSRNTHSGPFTKLYALWMTGQITLALLFIGFTHALNIQTWFWPQQHLTQIVLITFLEWAVGVALLLQQLGDSKGRTIYTQIITTLISFINSSALIGLALVNRLHLYSYIGLLYLTTLSSIAALSYYLLILNSDVCWDGKLSDHVRSCVRYWWGYASPLIVAGIYLTAYNYVDTYMIQRLYGAREQAFLALAVRFSSFVLIFTTSALTIYWREIARYLAAKDIPSAIRTYLRFNRLLFTPTLALGCWLAFNAPFIIELLSGRSYLEATRVLRIEAFYPLEQTLGQLSPIVFLASERTTAYRNLGILLSLPGLFLTYFFLAPKTAFIPGLGLGAAGVALKMAGYGLVSVQAYDYFNAKFFHISYTQLLLERLFTASVVVACGVLAFYGSRFISRGWSFSNVPFEKLVLNSGVYFSFIILILYFKPSLLGLDSNDFHRFFDFILKRLSRKT